MKKNRYARWMAGLVGTALTLGLCLPAYALEPTDQDTAAASLREQAVMVGGTDGDMRLDDPLSRAELAVLLSRISLNPEHVAWEHKFYASLCTFRDVPEWARVHVGVCQSNGLMAGYGNGLFGPSDPVTPQAACTVMLRYVERPTEYHAACDRAIELGLATEEMASKAEITRGDMAILIYQAMQFIEELNR